jgi:hypothetical protein
MKDKIKQVVFRCDAKNIGLSMLCKFDQDLPHPRVWSEQVHVHNFGHVGEPRDSAWFYLLCSPEVYGAGLC